MHIDVSLVVVLGSVQVLLEDGLGLVDVELGLELGAVRDYARAVGSAPGVGEVEVLVDDLLAGFTPVFLRQRLASMRRMRDAGVGRGEVKKKATMERDKREGKVRQAGEGGMGGRDERLVKAAQATERRERGSLAYQFPLPPPFFLVFLGSASAKPCLAKYLGM